MRTICIYESPDYRIESTGNGWGYTFTHKPTGKSVWFQDEDAGFFRDALTEAEENFALATDFIGSHLWCDHEYGTIANHTPVFPWGDYCDIARRGAYITVWHNNLLPVL